ncbi:unnamed protein product, partial [Prorocentrum cordatum]
GKRWRCSSRVARRRRSPRRWASRRESRGLRPQGLGGGAPAQAQAPREPAGGAPGEQAAGQLEWLLSSKTNEATSLAAENARLLSRVAALQEEVAQLMQESKERADAAIVGREHGAMPRAPSELRGRKKSRSKSRAASSSSRSASAAPAVSSRTSSHKEPAAGSDRRRQPPR